MTTDYYAVSQMGQATPSDNLRLAIEQQRGKSPAPLGVLVDGDFLVAGSFDITGIPFTMARGVGRLQQTVADAPFTLISTGGATIGFADLTYAKGVTPSLPNAPALILKGENNYVDQGVRCVGCMDGILGQGFNGLFIRWLEVYQSAGNPFTLATNGQPGSQSLVATVGGGRIRGAAGTGVRVLGRVNSYDVSVGASGCLKGGYDVELDASGGGILGNLTTNGDSNSLFHCKVGKGVADLTLVKPHLASTSGGPDLWVQGEVRLTGGGEVGSLELDGPAASCDVLSGTLFHGNPLLANGATAAQLRFGSGVLAGKLQQ